MSSLLDEVLDGVEPGLEMVPVVTKLEPPVLLSIDVGTSGVRAAYFDERGNELNGVKISRALGQTAFDELNPKSLVAEVIEAIDQLLNQSPAPVKIIAISTFWHSLVGIDSTGELTTSLLTWADTRATEQAKSLRSQFQENEIHLRTGCRFHSSYWPAKLSWLGQTQPKSFAETSHWLGFAEYLSLRLFGRMQASVSMASATGLFNQHTCDWDWDFVDALELDPKSLPPIMERNQQPSLTEEFNNRWPTLAGAKLAAVIGDGAANNIGGGCSTRNKCALMVGTSGAMRVAFRGDPPRSLPSSLWSYRIDRQRVVVGGALSDGGGLYQWLTESMRIDEDPSVLQAQLAAIDPDSHGLTILPFWSGERSTGWTGDARGAILGLTQETKPVAIVRAALEGIAYRFALIAKALETVAPGSTVIATGNALRSSPVWPQIIADVLGKPLMFGGTPEASIRGAALLALEAVGKIGSIEEVSVSVDEVFEPNMHRHARYQEAIERQEQFYQKLVG